MAAPGSVPVALGIDIGGTATRALIVDAAGRRRGAGRSAGGNPTAHPPAVWSRALSEALGQALDESGPGAEVRSVVVGVAGDRALAEGDAAAAFESIIRGRVGAGCPIRMTGDVVVAFASGTPAADGTVLVAGTGAAAAAIEDRAPASETDGYGWLLGDAGSGFWIGRQAVRAVLADLDGRGPATGLRPLVTDSLLGRGFAEPGPRRMCLEIVNAAHARPPVDLSRLAPLVSRCAGAGDQVALRIARTAVGHLIASVQAVRPDGAATPLVVTGGVAAGEHPIAGLLRERLEACWPGCVRSAHDGVAGATWLALTALPGADQAKSAELHRAVAARHLQLCRTPEGRMRGADGARIWYQSFTDPDTDGAYFTRLGSYLRSLASPGCAVEVSLVAGGCPGSPRPLQCGGLPVGVGVRKVNFLCASANRPVSPPQRRATPPGWKHCWLVVPTRCGRLSAAECVDVCRKGALHE